MPIGWEVERKSPNRNPPRVTSNEFDEKTRVRIEEEKEPEDLAIGSFPPLSPF
jgi:hypothetical protein